MNYTVQHQKNHFMSMKYTECEYKKWEMLRGTDYFTHPSPTSASLSPHMKMVFVRRRLKELQLIKSIHSSLLISFKLHQSVQHERISLNLRNEAS